jgi:hypothetical protein
MKRFLQIVFILFVLLIFPLFIENASSQPPPPPPQDIPIDGGLSLLIIAGAAYGARRIYKNQKQETETNSDTV